MRAVERLALRCILPGFTGTVAPEWVRRRTAEGMGGVVLFSRNVADREQLRSLVDSLHAERAGALVAIDEEGGDVTRLEARAGSSYPGNLALGAARDPDLTSRVARSMGAELAGAGIDLNLAPVADVNSNPLNPVIGVRSFGADAETVSRQTAAWVAGLQSAGVAACAKHFPGHGDTALDSHVELPVAAADPHAGALAPFEAAIGAGVRAVMSAHILVPAIDDQPATISHKVMTGLLRDELGFTGMAISDGLDMRGLSADRGLGDAAVLALNAGCDALCIGGGPTEGSAVDEVLAALVLGVTAERLAQAARRVDALSAWRTAQPVRAKPDPAVGLEAARFAVRCEGDVRVGDAAVIWRLETRPSFAADEMPWGVAGALAARGVHVTEGDHERAGSSFVIVVRDLHRHPDQRANVEAALDRRPDAVVVEMGLPACRPRGVSAYITTFGSARVCGVAAAESMHP